MKILYTPPNIYNNLNFDYAKSNNIAFNGLISKTKGSVRDVFVKSKTGIKTKLKNAKTNAYMSLYNRIKGKLNIIDIDVINNEIAALRTVFPELAEEIMEEVNNTSLNYDIMNPPDDEENTTLFKPDDYTDRYEDIKIGTNNRSDMKELDVKSLRFSNGLTLELPAGEMKIKRTKLKPLDAPFEVQSNISEKYSESVVWDNDKIARDLLQNFFDGHGQTLDGVKFIIKPLKGISKYSVRIEGKSTYNYREAVLMGESSSHQNARAAGNYGEGLKMVALKLLTQKETPNVKIGSGNWNVTCELKKDQRLDADVMSYRIEPVNEYDGNFIEFETTDSSLVSTIVKSINRFYHSSNPHFKNPDFENELFGIKLTGSSEDGGLYISGQRFEYGGSYDNIEGAIFIKEKIPTDIYNMTRDRSSIDSYSLRKIADWLAKRSTNKECKQVVKCLEQYAVRFSALKKVYEEFFDSLADRIFEKKTGAIKFPDNYLARVSFIDSDLESDLKKNGYRLFLSKYNRIGMKSVTELIKKSKQHIPLEPTKTEQMKIILLKKALRLLSNLTEKHFSKEELDANIYIFDGKSKMENAIRTYKYVKAEAITKNDKCIGFWIDRSYLDKTDFGNALETALHELSHKAGGDGSEEFGYKLTDVNGDTFKQIFDNPKIAVELKIINDMWSKL